MKWEVRVALFFSVISAMTKTYLFNKLRSNEQLFKILSSRQLAVINIRKHISNSAKEKRIVLKLFLRTTN